LQLLNISDSIESAYDDWITAGGMHRKHFHGLLCVRSAPTIAPDKEILKQITNTLTITVGFGRENRNYSNSHNGVENMMSSECYCYSGCADYEFDSERIIVGSMILRQHFKMLTNALLRPFEGFFKPAPNKNYFLGSGNSDHGSGARSGSVSSLFNSSFSFANSNTGINAVAGATSMILYSNPLLLLGKSNINSALTEFGLYNGNIQSLPRPLRKGQWKALMFAFAKSDTFHAWCRWRRELESLQLLLLSSQACVNMSPRELITAYAVQQQCLSGPNSFDHDHLEYDSDDAQDANSDEGNNASGRSHNSNVDKSGDPNTSNSSLTKKDDPSSGEWCLLSELQLKQLLVRIVLTVKALYVIEQRYFPPMFNPLAASAAGVGPDNRSFSTDSNNSGYNNRGGGGRSGGSGRSNFVDIYQRQQQVVRPGDLIFVMKRHFAAICAIIQNGCRYTAADSVRSAPVAAVDDSAVENERIGSSNGGVDNLPYSNNNNGDSDDENDNGNDILPQQRSWGVYPTASDDSDIDDDFERNSDASDDD
jgi:hypothetical protein